MIFFINSFSDEAPEAETTGINTSAIIQAVNESAEEGIAFFSNLLGLAFGKPNGTEPVSGENEETTQNPVKSSTVQPENSPQTPDNKLRKSKQLNLKLTPNDI